ncbi:MAG TPA: FtsX-like permease family protein [Terrimesophilobacter sp.]|nr:FtsX-like permease family protein [Terrimesophilobacter sp.]
MTEHIDTRRADGDETSLQIGAQVASASAQPVRAHRPLRALSREAVASAIAAPIASIITIVMIAGMCAAVLLTSGRTVGAEQAVIGSIDSAGTRSIIVRAQPDAGLDTSVLERIGHLTGIQWTGAFGPARDVQNAAFPGGTRVPLRLAWGQNWHTFGLPDPLPGKGDVAFASPRALEQLGITGRSGAVDTPAGTVYAVTGPITVPDQLAFLEPLLIAPQPRSDNPTPVSLLVVIASRPDLVAPVADAITGVLATDDPTKVSVETSQDLATLRSLIQGQLGSFGRGLTVGIFALTGLLAAAILYGLVMLRRKDFGRRRALGASQRLIIALLVTQTAILAASGAVLGTVTAVIVLATAHDPLPGPDYLLGIAVLAVTVGVLASLAPALAAARREPITELRVP